jgi:hypothetical protein
MRGRGTRSRPGSVLPDCGRKPGPGTPRLRPIDLPRPVRVRTDGSGQPVAVHGRRGPVRIEAIREAWRIDDEWWRIPVSRSYFQVVLEGGRPLLLFHDRVEDRWYFQ